MNTPHTGDRPPQADVLFERRGAAGLVTLNRPKALNALSLPMVQALLQTLTAWRDDPAVHVVAIRGTNKVGRPGTPESLFGGFCAGGDIRFFHQAALAGDAALEEFFTDEYTLNHLIQTYSKPVVAFMDGVVMGGGMGLCQGARVRVVTEHTRMAMPETNIGLFPDVGGGYFLSRCPGHVGEYLALTGEVIGADDAIAWGLADTRVESHQLPLMWDALAGQEFASCTEAAGWLDSHWRAAEPLPVADRAQIDTFFALERVKHIVDALERSADPWALKTATTLRKRSPLMLHVALEQIRRARSMSLADDLRMERDMVYRCFHIRPGAASETVEGIRALAVDKDYKPVWSPARIEDVKADMTAAFFISPWTSTTHPLRGLGAV